MIIDRDGFTVADCLKGDQYFNDLSKTYGHVSMLNDGMWHPKKRNLFVTASADGTIRVWDTDATQLNNTLKSTNCGRCRLKQSGARPPVLCVLYSPDAKLLVAGCEGGSIHSFIASDKKMMPKAVHYTAHEEACTSLAFSRSGTTIVSRGTGATLGFLFPSYFWFWLSPYLRISVSPYLAMVCLQFPLMCIMLTLAVCCLTMCNGV